MAMSVERVTFAQILHLINKSEMEQNDMMAGMPRRERAVMYKRNYNCCQAVLLAFAPELDLPHNLIHAP